MGIRDSRILQLVVTLSVFAAASAQALVIHGGDVSDTVAPAEDGSRGAYEHVGSVRGLGAVYLGDNVVLTAAHVGVGDRTLGGVSYEAVPGSGTGFGSADLLMFQILPMIRAWACSTLRRTRPPREPTS